MELVFALLIVLAIPFALIQYPIVWVLVALLGLGALGIHVSHVLRGWTSWTKL